MPLLSASVCYITSMRKKQEYQTKVYRLDKETNEQLLTYCEENGIAQAYVQSQAVKIYLAMKAKA